MKKALFFLICAFFIFQTQTVNAEERMVFDSADNYLGACSYTSTSEWTLEEAIEVTTFEVWYNWQAGETELAVTIEKNGVEFANFSATRGVCDPYQATWCNADYTINKTFPVGTYTTSIPNARQCLKPGGTGVIRLYENDGVITATNDNTNVSTNSNTSINTNTNPARANDNANLDINQNQNVNAITAVTDDKEENSTVIYVLIGVIVLLIVVIISMVINCKKK